MRSSPHAVAGGLALGTFVAFTPTVGIQLILALALATAWNVNRPAALIPVWISNPVTVAPLYTFMYWLGSKIYPGPPLSEVSSLFINFSKALAHLEIWDMKEQFKAVLEMGVDILIPLLIGSLIIGVVAGSIVYLVSRRLVYLFLHRRAMRHRLNEQEKKEDLVT